MGEFPPTPESAQPSLCGDLAFWMVERTSLLKKESAWQVARRCIQMENGLTSVESQCPGIDQLSILNMILEGECPSA